MRYCSECKNDSLCDRCDNLVNQKKEFSANLHELKREKPNKFVLYVTQVYNNLNIFVNLSMVIKSIEYFEKTRHVKTNDKSKK